MKSNIPPVLVMFFALALMLIIDRYLPFGMLTFEGHRLVSEVIFGLAVLSGVLALWEFFKASTTIDPHSAEKVSTLVASGIYRFSRNPMYLALVLVLVAAALYLGNIATIAVIPFFLLYLHFFQIKPEEQVLAEKFGKQYQEYRNNVRRWI